MRWIEEGRGRLGEPSRGLGPAGREDVCTTGMPENNNNNNKQS